MFLCPHNFRNEPLCLQRNITYITDPGVRDIMLNKTWGALVPKLPGFKPKDYERWFGFLLSLIPSFTIPHLELLPANISCESYAVM